MGGYHLRYRSIIKGLAGKQQVFFCAEISGWATGRSIQCRRHAGKDLLLIPDKNNRASSCFNYYGKKKPPFPAVMLFSTY